MKMSEPGLTPLVPRVPGGPVDSCQAKAPALNVPRDYLLHKSSSSTVSCYSKYTIGNGGFYHYYGRKRRKSDGSGESNFALVDGFRSSHGLLVVLKPLDPSQLITKINPLNLYEKL